MNRNLTPQEVAAMWIFADEYAKQQRGIIDFYLLLPGNRKKLVDKFLQELNEAEVATVAERADANQTLGNRPKS